MDATDGCPYFLQEWGKHTWNTAESSPIDVNDDLESRAWRYRVHGSPARRVHEAGDAQLDTSIQSAEVLARYQEASQDPATRSEEAMRTTLLSALILCVALTPRVSAENDLFPVAQAKHVLNAVE